MSTLPNRICIHHTDAERQAATIGACPVCTARELAALRAENAALRAALTDFVYYADNSQGIVGWHLNGAVLRWEEVEAIDAARAALAKEGGK